MNHLQDIEEAEDLLLTDEYELHVYHDEEGLMHSHYLPVVKGGQGRTGQEVRDIANGLLVLLGLWVLFVIGWGIASYFGLWS